MSLSNPIGTLHIFRDIHGHIFGATTTNIRKSAPSYFLARFFKTDIFLDTYICFGSVIEKCMYFFFQPAMENVFENGFGNDLGNI